MNPKWPNLVCKLLKAIYGLNQAPKQCYAKINSFDLKFRWCDSEPFLYIKHTKGSIMAWILHTDDFFISGDIVTELKEIKDEFKNRFHMKDLGSASDFVGIQILRDRMKYTLHISQKSYICKIHDRFDMNDSKPFATPIQLQSTKNMRNSYRCNPSCRIYTL